MSAGQVGSAGGLAGGSHGVSLSSRSIQDIAILFNVIIIFLMFFNTFVFQAGLVNLLFHKFKGTILLSAAYLALSIAFHVWVMVRMSRDNLVSPCDSLHKYQAGRQLPHPQKSSFPPWGSPAAPAQCWHRSRHWTNPRLGLWQRLLLYAGLIPSKRQRLGQPRPQH